jgi:hypothetical protein
MQLKKIKKVVIILAILSVPVITKAQPGGGDGDPGAPIDGGISLLLAAGAAYGVKKYRQGKKEEEQEK